MSPDSSSTGTDDDDDGYYNDDDDDDDKNTLKICPFRALPPICHRILPALTSRHPVSKAVTIPKNLPQLLLASSTNLFILNCGLI